MLPYCHIVGEQLEALGIYLVLPTSRLLTMCGAGD